MTNFFSQFHTDDDLANKVEWQESRGNQNAVSPKGAFGVMQLMPETARDPGFGIAPLDPNAPDPEE
jgi:soluble lytic murein transglycosylase